MDPDSKEFERLQALLALKRHEQPPPGFFTHFSSKVIARIQAEEMEAGRSGWRRWIRQLQLSPVLTCAYGVVVASLLILGINWASHRDPQTADGLGIDLGSPVAMPAPGDLPAESAFPQLASPLPVMEVGTNPPGGLLASNSPFSPPQLPIERARFQPPNR